MNFWKQTTHVMSYFPEENFRGHERLPKNFMNAFLEVRLIHDNITFTELVIDKHFFAGSQLEMKWGIIPCVHSNPKEEIICPFFDIPV
jgi:hypothetical protein